MRQGQVQVNGSTKQVDAADFGALTQVFNIGVLQGTLMPASAAAGVQGPGQGQGSRGRRQVTVTFNDTGTVTVPVAAIYSDSGVLGNWVIDLDTYAANTTSQLDTYVAASWSDHAPDAATRSGMGRSVTRSRPRDVKQTDLCAPRVSGEPARVAGPEKTN